MAMDFPPSPTEGQTYQAPGGPLYTYRAPAWRSGVIGIPAPPSDGSAYVMRNGVWEKTGWRVLGRLTPSASGTTQWDIALGGAKTVRISGAYRPTALSSYLYKAGASDYSDAILRQQQTTVSGQASASAGSAFVTANSDTATVNNIPFLFMASNGGTNFKYWTTSTGYWAGGAAGPTLDTHHGWSNTSGTVTHIRLLVTTGSIDVGTDITVEAPS
jgi:hypothetical protein